MVYLTSVGLDAHARSISACALVHETGETRSATFGYDPAAVAAWVAGLPQPARCVYESGPGGFALKRSLEELGVECLVGAVSKMVRPAGDRVKTDARDAGLLARMLATGCVVECWVPEPFQEAARDLARARADARADLMRARNRLSKMLLRKGLVYPGRSTWTRAHMEWIDGVEPPEPCERLVLSELVCEVAAAEARRCSPGSPSSLARLGGLAPEAARVASEGNRRLRSKAARLRARGVAPGKANAAVARELAGFVWALALCEG